MYKTAIRDRRRIIISCIFALLFSPALVCGLHLHIEDIYAGTKESNYIASFSIADCMVLAVSFLVIWFMMFNILDANVLEMDWSRRIPKKDCGIMAAILSACYFPWLLAYYPGFIFSDSLNSVSQAIGRLDYSNHHPILYTKVIDLCMHVGRLIAESNTVGLALYSLCQLLLMALICAYITVWCRQRFGLGKWSLIAGTVIYGMLPYVAAYSVAIWKDPAFSLALAALSCMLMDYVHCKRRRVSQGIAMTLLCIVLIASRNNGVFVVTGALLISCIITSKNTMSNNSKVIATALIMVIASVFVTNVVFDRLHLNDESKVESYSVPLNQMARVAAYDLNMSSEEQNYLDEMLPIRDYSSKYRPCCVDLLKWDEDFNRDTLETDFFSNWLSIGIKHPKAYLESWVLTSGGFWLPYSNASFKYDDTIAGGVPRNFDRKYDEELKTKYKLYTKNLLSNTEARRYLKIKSKSVPVGTVFWILLILVSKLIYRREYETIAAGTSLSLGLILTLAVGSPIFYWPRYGFAVQLLLPIFLLMIIATEGDNANETEARQS